MNITAVIPTYCIESLHDARSFYWRDIQQQQANTARLTMRG